MGIYIKNRDMPDACGSCPCFHAENPMYCQAVKAAVQKPRIVHPYAKGRPEWCPLVYVPEHGDLIDRHDLKYKEMTIDYDEWDDTFDDGLLFVTGLIDSAPTIIPAEPKEE